MPHAPIDLPFAGSADRVSIVLLDHGLLFPGRRASRSCLSYTERSRDSRKTMGTIADRIYRDSEPGALVELTRAGNGLEHPLVFDATARELCGLAERGMVEVVHRRETQGCHGSLLDQMSFRKIG